MCVSGIFLGVVWALWHLPLFFIPQSSQYNYPLIVHVLYTIILSMVITFVFERTKRNITFAIILHSASNALITSLAFSYSSVSNLYSYIRNNQLIKKA
ncbi:CPBP family intramembrane glutamic endopeptidase [Inconstantimicrobium porci]|uniref:CPBP family intramembrane glutamic endopeptidase n=1 Tax=Inconstantimicrobium porci TaxID=2652291 RepID=UPI00389A5FCE